MKTRQVALLAVLSIAFSVTLAVGGTDVRVATWNIETVGEPTSAEYLAALSVLNRIGADVVAVNGVSGSADSLNLESLALDAGYPFVIVAGESPLGAMRNAFMSTLPITSSAVYTAADLSGDPSANDLTRYIVSIKIDVPDVDRPLVLITEHWKSGSADDSEFRRAVESLRIVDAFDEQVPGDAVVIMGDMEEEIDSVPRDPNPFVGLPAGLPPEWILGADLVAELASLGIKNDPFTYLLLDSVTAVGALQLDGSDATQPASGRRLDYIFINTFVDGGVGEAYDSADEGLPGGLPKVGSPPAPGASGDASGHLVVFADVVVPAWPRVEPISPPDNARLDIRVGGVLWDRVSDFHDSDEHDLHYKLQRDHEQNTYLLFGDGIPGAVPPFGAYHDPIQFLLPELPDSTTHWWRACAREEGSAVWGPWSEPRSFTHDTTNPPPAPLADWHQTTTKQFLTDQLNNATAVNDAVMITDEALPGSIITPLIDLTSLHGAGQHATFVAWKNIVVNAEHPDNNTSVTIDVYNDSGLLVAGPVVDSGAGIRDVTVDLALVTDPVIYVVITMTPGSTPLVHSITVSGDEATATGIEDKPGRPMQYALYQNIPNPFNPVTDIRYDLPDGGGDVAIRIYDVCGRLVRTLVDRHESGGTRSVAWDGTDAKGQRVVSGIYFYRLTAQNYEQTRKMLLLK